MRLLEEMLPSNYFFLSSFHILFTSSLLIALRKLSPANYNLENVQDPHSSIFALQIGQIVEEKNLELDLPEFIELGMEVFNASDIPVKNAMLANKTKRNTNEYSHYTFTVKF